MRQDGDYSLRSYVGAVTRSSSRTLCGIFPGRGARSPRPGRCSGGRAQRGPTERADVGGDSGPHPFGPRPGARKDAADAERVLFAELLGARFVPRSRRPHPAPSGGPRAVPPARSELPARSASERELASANSMAATKSPVFPSGFRPRCGPSWSTSAPPLPRAEVGHMGARHSISRAGDPPAPALR